MLTITFLSVAGVAALAVGLFAIAKTHVALREKSAATGPSTGRTPDPDAFDRRDDRRIAMRFGASMLALGAVLVVLDVTGIVLSATTATIISSLVVIFLVSHASHAKHLRALRRERAAALRAGDQTL